MVRQEVIGTASAQEAVAEAAPAMEGSNINLTFSPPKVLAKSAAKPEATKATVAVKPEAKPAKDKEISHA